MEMHTLQQSVAYRQGCGMERLACDSQHRILKQEQSKKRSVRGKRLDAGWNNDYLWKVLTN
ncbi:hypothetical protein AGMMS4957_09870 [Bacteroidia bacterium]|nr:hypothetical protein AGMMS4957_09870 [Bacteroidia bacterium]